MASPNDCSMTARTLFAVLGVVLGLAVGVVFSVHFNNIHASVWGFISGAAAAYTLYVHVTYMKEHYEEDPQPLRRHMLSGCFIQLAGVCSFVAYIALAINDKQGVVVYGAGYYVAAVWGAMTWKWGFQLFWFSRAYWRRIVASTQLLPPPYQEKAVA